MNCRVRHAAFDLPLTLYLVVNPLLAQDTSRSPSKGSELQAALEHTQVLVERIRTASYPELNAAKIQVRPLGSSSDFFRARPRIPDFFIRKRVRFVIRVNPSVYELKAPEGGTEAILAHELGHVLYFRKRNRLRQITMIRFLSRSFARDFERRTDLEAMTRGYGEGLKAYRGWLYQHVPQKDLVEKRRNYFSPEEVGSILLGMRRCPQLLDSWFKRPPRNLQESQVPASCQSGQ